MFSLAIQQKFTGGRGILWDGGYFIYSISRTSRAVFQNELKIHMKKEHGHAWKITWQQRHLSNKSVFLFFSESLVRSLGKFGTRPWKTASQTHLATSELSTSRKPEKIRWYYSLLPCCSRAARTTIALHDCSFLLSSSPLALPAMHRFWGMKNWTKPLLISALTFQHDDVPHLRPPSCPNRNRFTQPDAGHPASNSSSSCLTSESVSGFKKARDKYLLKATRRARSSARTRSAMSDTLLQTQRLNNASSEVTILMNSAKKCLSMHWQTGLSPQNTFNALRTIFCSFATPPMSMMRRKMRNRNSGHGYTSCRKDANHQKILAGGSRSSRQTSIKWCTNSGWYNCHRWRLCIQRTKPATDTQNGFWIGWRHKAISFLSK